MIPFNKPYFSGKELEYIKTAILSGKISGNGQFTRKCHTFFEQTYGFHKCLLTASGTDALEMCAILADIKPGDEVIVPSYTFVSTALAFVRQGANIVFIDSRNDHPNLNENSLEPLITENTKAIVPVHYAGIACDMDKILHIAQKHNLLVIEDAAQAIDSFYKNKALGSIGDMAIISFHETKNIISGEGGLLIINNNKFIDRAEIIWEKGTNRAKFNRGEVDKYNWLDIGSSFLPSEITSAILWAQIENIKKIQNRRKLLWNRYYDNLHDWAIQNKIKLPIIPDYATNNAHMFYLIFNTSEQRNNVIDYLNFHNITAIFHYLSLHNSPYSTEHFPNRNKLINAEYYSDHLLRLPLYYELKEEEIDEICHLLINYKYL